MKTHIFTLACIFTLISGTAFAQEANSPLEEASAATRDMSSKLGLNEGEYIRLRTLNADRFASEAQINKMYSNDISMREKKLAELHNSYEAELKDFLNQKQLDAYAAYKKGSTNYTALSEEATK